MGSEVLGSPRDAIVYVPGLGEWIDHSLEGFAQRFSLELRRKARSPQARFVIESVLVGEEPVALPGKDTKISMCSIQHREADQLVASIDVFKFDFAATMVKNFERKNLLSKSLRLLVGILLNVPRVFYAIFGRNRPKQLHEVIQVLFGVGSAALLIVYIFILGIAVFDTIEGSPEVRQLISQVLPGSISPGDAEPGDTPVKTHSLTLAQNLVILLALLEIFIPEARQMIEKTAVDDLCILDYLSLGERQSVILGQLDDLLRGLANTGLYQEINLVAFSFGSIVALDRLFPYGKKPGEGAAAVHSLVTIGCPFDVVRIFWPHYFQGRQVPVEIPQRWFNIYSPVDVLGSKFELQQGTASEILTRKSTNIVYTGGINPANLSKLAWLTLVGLRAHTAYWEKDAVTEASCMEEVVGKLYGDEAH
jgi:hypothetical protein